MKTSIFICIFMTFSIWASGLEYKSPELRLQIAAKNGDLEAVKKELASGANPNGLFESTDLSPLMLAAEKGHLDVVKELLKKPQVIEKADQLGKDQQSALLLAVQYGHADIIRELLSLSPIDKKKMVNQKDKFGYTALMYAAQNGDLEAVKNLIAAGAELNMKSSSLVSETPLMMAAARGHLDIVNELLEHNEVYAHRDEKIPFPSGDDRTALAKAADMSRPKVVARLIETGANICAIDYNRITYLLDDAQTDPVDSKNSNLKKLQLYTPEEEYKRKCPAPVKERSVFEKIDDFIGRH